MKKELWALALEIDQFVKYYVPKGWRGPIHEFVFPPMFTEEQVKVILNGGIPIDNVLVKNHWYIHEAINEWKRQHDLS